LAGKNHILKVIMFNFLKDLFWLVLFFIFIGLLIFGFSILIMIVFGGILIVGIISLFIPDKKPPEK